MGERIGRMGVASSNCFARNGPVFPYGHRPENWIGLVVGRCPVKYVTDTGAVSSSERHYATHPSFNGLTKEDP
jgi:hypothetical protein